MPYLSWQNLLKNHLWFLGKSSKRSFRKGRTKKKLKLRQNNQSLENTKQQAEIAQKQAVITPQKLATLNPTGLEVPKVELITMLKLFLERKHISQQIEETIPDYRNQELVTYSKQSIMLSALSIFLLRLESGNNFDVKSHDSDEKYSRVDIAKFINAPEECVPVIKTIERFLKRLGENSINELMISFFKDLQQSKFFKQHPQIMPGDFFLLAADCVHTHTYDHLHHTDRQGNNDCPCCLKRVYNKGTELVVRIRVKYKHSKRLCNGIKTSSKCAIIPFCNQEDYFPNSKTSTAFLGSMRCCGFLAKYSCSEML